MKNKFTEEEETTIENSVEKLACTSFTDTESTRLTVLPILSGISIGSKIAIERRFIPDYVGYSPKSKDAIATVVSIQRFPIGADNLLEIIKHCRKSFIKALEILDRVGIISFGKSKYLVTVKFPKFPRKLSMPVHANAQFGLEFDNFEYSKEGQMKPTGEVKIYS